MKFSEIKDMTVQELRKKLTLSKAQLFELKMKNKLEQVNNPLEIRHIRRSIAKMNTAITQKLR